VGREEPFQDEVKLALVTVFDEFAGSGEQDAEFGFGMGGSDVGDDALPAAAGGVFGDLDRGRAGCCADSPDERHNPRLYRPISA
jgi:hypothetical protein